MRKASFRNRRVMTVTLATKHDIAKTDDNDNETCCMNKHQIKENNTANPLLSTLPLDTQRESPPSPSSSSSSDYENNQDNLCYYEKCRKLLSYHEAPEYLRHNSYILSGYRGILNTKLCLESIFWWTNETINIWSHLFGLMLFVALAIYDLILLKVHASVGDKIIVAVVLACFQACMAFSSLYHTFSCRSENDFNCFLSFDLFGIALSLLAIYTSGIYYAFWCTQNLQNFYLITVTFIFMVAIAVQHPKLNFDSNVKTLVFVAWAAYGVIPTFHWSIIMGGFENPVVALLLPRVLGMYVISGIAFFIYLTKIPERFYVGKFDFIGHSHQWWHFFVLLALYYWHNTGMLYVDYRLNHACSDNMRLP